MVFPPLADDLYRCGEVADARRFPADVARMGFVDVSVLPDEYGHVPRAPQDVARLGERDGDLGPERGLVLGVARDGDPRLGVAVLGEARAVEPDAGGGPAPDVGDAELAVRRLDDRRPRLVHALELLERHAVESAKAVGVHGRLEGLHVGRARGPPRGLQALRHLVRVVLLHRLADKRVDRVGSRLQEDAASEADAVDVGDERGEVRRDRDRLAPVLLVGGPGGLARDLRACRERRGPFHAEEVVVALRELAHMVALPRLDDDLGYRAARRVPVVLLAFDGGLHHLVGDVGRQPREALLRRLVLPEAEQRGDELADGEGDEDEGEHPREDAAQRGGGARDRAAYRLRRCALRRDGGLGPAGRLGGLCPDRGLDADGRRLRPLGGACLRAPRGAGGLPRGRPGSRGAARRLGRSCGAGQALRPNP